MYTKYHDEYVHKGWNKLKKSKQFFHIPPTAYPIKQQDFFAGISAAFHPVPSLDNFVNELNEIIGLNCNLVSSGRSAMTLALLSLKKKKKARKVVIPAYSCSTVLQSVLTAELEPVFCDVSPVTLDFEQNQLDQVITEETLAVIGVHLYGIVQDFSQLVKQTSTKNIFFIEDAAQCFGGKIGGEMVGTQGDFAIFSLGRGKTLPTNGGGVIASKPEFQPWIEETLTKFASAPIAGLKHIIGLTGYSAAVNPIGWWLIARSKLNPAHAGDSLQQLPKIQHIRLSAFQAGLGSSILQRTSEVYKIWRKNAAELSKLLKNYSFVTIPKTAESAQSVYLRFPIILDNKIRAERLANKLNNAGIGASRSYRFTLPGFLNDSEFTQKNYPGASKLSECLLTLPTNHFLDRTSSDIISHIFQEEEMLYGS